MVGRSTHDISKNPDKRYLDMKLFTEVWAQIDAFQSRLKKKR